MSTLIALSIARDANAGLQYCRECLTQWYPDQTPRHHNDCNSVEEGHERRPACPDGGTCHNRCDKLNGGLCERVTSCEPLSGVFPDNRWPEEIVSAHTPRPTTIEDVTVGDKVLHGGEWVEVRGFSVHPEAGISLMLAGRGWTHFKDGQEVEIEEAD